MTTRLIKMELAQALDEMILPPSCHDGLVYLVARNDLQLIVRLQTRDLNLTFPAMDERKNYDLPG